MARNIADIQAALCESGIGKVQNPVLLLQLTAQNAANWVKANSPDADISVQAIMARACESGIARVTDQQILLALIATKLCQAS